MATIDPHELAKWERGETEPSRFVRAWWNFWHNYFPMLFGSSLSITRLFFGFFFCSDSLCGRLG